MNNNLRMLTAGVIGLTIGATTITFIDSQKNEKLYNDINIELGKKEERIKVLEKKLEEAEPYFLYKIDQQLLKEHFTLEWMKENE